MTLDGSEGGVGSVGSDGYGSIEAGGISSNGEGKTKSGNGSMS